MAPPSPTQLALRRHIEAGLRIAAPALDLLLAAGDRVSRAVDREDAQSAVPGAADTVVASRRRVGLARVGASDTTRDER